MMQINKYSILAFASIVQIFWVMVIANQNKPLVIAAAIIGLNYFFAIFSYRYIIRLKWFSWLLLGSTTGYIVGLAASLIGECYFRGNDCIYRIGSNFYFPFYSFSWLYSAIYFSLIGFYSKESHR